MSQDPRILPSPLSRQSAPGFTFYPPDLADFSAFDPSTGALFEAAADGIVVHATGGGTQTCRLVDQAAPSGDFEAIAALEIWPGGNGAGNCGLALLDGAAAASRRFSAICWHGDANVYAIRFNTPTVYGGSTPATTGLMRDAPRWYRARRIGTSFDLSYSFSPDRGWRVLHTEAISTYQGSIARVGVYANSNIAGGSRPASLWLQSWRVRSL